MHDLTDIADCFLENAVGRRVGDHQRCQSILVLFRFVFKIVQIDIAAGVASNHDDFHASEYRAGWIRAMG